MMTCHFRLRSRPLHLLIRKSRNNDYYISDRGYILSVPNEIHGAERDRIIKSKKTILKPSIIKTKAYPGAMAVIRINNKRLILKNEVIKAFTNKKVMNYWQVQHKDGNPENCSLNNLIWISQDEMNIYQGTTSLVVYFKNKRIQEFKSVEEAADKLFVSRTTLYRFIYGKAKNSSLNENIERIEVLKPRKSKKSNLSLEEIKHKEK